MAKGILFGLVLLACAGVAPGQTPTLTSVAPGFLSQGGTHVRLTLVGTNFNCILVKGTGATRYCIPTSVVIGPAGFFPNPRLGPAPDVQIETVLEASPNLLMVTISLSRAAGIGIRSLDVLNANGASTEGALGAAGGTTKPLQVSRSSSLGAPLSVTTAAMIHPRDGTLISQGDAVYGEAVLAGTGSGTVIGEWVWDGLVTEQFTAAFAGGRRVVVRSQNPFPAQFLGEHTIELRIIQPNQVLTPPVRVVVNPGQWHLQAILGPPWGAGFASDNPPLLRWAPVPGAAKYQVGFSTQPYFGAIREWQDVTDNEWQVPAETWSRLAGGQLYWTVRALDNEGGARKPLPMRPIMHYASGALKASGAPGRTAAGTPLLAWQGLGAETFYQITVSANADGSKPVRVYLTKEPKVDLRALGGKLVPGQTYFWRVRAILPDGRVALSGPMQSFIAPNAASELRPDGAADAGEHTSAVDAASDAAAEDNPPPADLEIEAAGLRRARARNGRKGAQDIASLIASRTPAPDSSVAETKPAITVQFNSRVNAADLSLMVDDTDVTSLLQITDTQISYAPALDLPGGVHEVNLSIGSAATGWKFTVQLPPAATAGAQGGGQFAQSSDAEAPPAPAASSGGAAAPAQTAGGAAAAGQTQAAGAQTTSQTPASTASPSGATGAPSEKAPVMIGPQMDTQIGTTTQWASGGNPDTNAVTFGQQMSFQDGRWRVEMNGSGLLSSTFSPESQQTAIGRVNDYVIRTAYGKSTDAWGANLRFGVISPALYTDAQFVTAATPRQGAEFTLKTPAGSFAYFANTNDAALGSGSGITFHQALRGASWLAPIPQKWAEFRLMWLSAQDVGAATTVQYNSQGQPIQSANLVGTPGSGDAYGGLLIVHLSQKWQWTSEYSWAYDNPDVSVAGTHRLFGRAWRTGISGLIATTAISLDYVNVGPNFASPANPSLTLMSNPDRRGVDFSSQTPTKLGTLALGYSFLESDVNDALVPEAIMHNVTENWSKALDPKTVLSLQGHETLTITGNVPASVRSQPPAQQLLVEADQRDYGANVTATRQVGKVSLSLGGSRDWFRNNNVAGQNVITSAITGGASWAGPQWFQMTANVSVNWVAANAATVGGTRTVTGLLQPTFLWKGFQLIPLVSTNTVRTQLLGGVLTADSLTGQYGGRLQWTMPGILKFSAISFEGDATRYRDNINGQNMRDSQLLGVWTLTWHRHLGPVS